MWRSGGVWARIRPAAAVVVLAVGTGVLTGTGPVTSAANDIRLVQFNMCGHSCVGTDADKVGPLVNSLAGLHPAAVSLDEVCGRQLADVVDGIARRGWAMSSRFMVTKRNGCGGGVDYGIAVLTRSAIVGADLVAYAAQAWHTSEFRGFLCVTAALGRGPTRVCTTHIVASDEDPGGQLRRAQVIQVGSVASQFDSRGVPVVLMGDFNLRPTDSGMSPLYSPAHGGGGYGVFDEVAQGPASCRCGEFTVGSRAKYDYIFVTGRDFIVARANVTRLRFSDHALLAGWVLER